jgi:hypothetical protein
MMELEGRHAAAVAAEVALAPGFTDKAPLNTTSPLGNTLDAA